MEYVQPVTQWCHQCTSASHPFMILYHTVAEFLVCEMRLNSVSWIRHRVRTQCVSVPSQTSISLQRRRIFVNRHDDMETGLWRVDESTGVRQSWFRSWFPVLGAVVHDAFRSVFFCHFSGFVHRNQTVAPPTGQWLFQTGTECLPCFNPVQSNNTTPTGNERLPLTVTPTAKGSSHSVEPECIYL